MCLSTVPAHAKSASPETTMAVSVAPQHRRKGEGIMMPTSSVHRAVSSPRGQGLVEYALILVLVAIFVIAALMIMGPVVANVFSTINNSMGSIPNP
jgi:pilus assembly protein Flp/PilA